MGPGPLFPRDSISLMEVCFLWRDDATLVRLGASSYRECPQNKSVFKMAPSSIRTKLHDNLNEVNSPASK